MAFRFRRIAYNGGGLAEARKMNSRNVPPEIGELPLPENLDVLLFLENEFRYCDNFCLAKLL